MIQTESFLKVAIDSLEEMRRWLARFKKSGPVIYVDLLDVLDEVHCRGWVDGLAHKMDDERTMQLISPVR